LVETIVVGAALGLTSCGSGGGEMKTDIRTTTLWRDLRIIWAITSKDLLDAVKSKTTLSILLSALFIVVIYQVLPTFERASDLPTVLIYDAGASDLLPALKRSPHLDVYTGYTSQDQLESKLVAGDIPELALAIPPGFDEAMKRGEPPVLEGYVQHWVSDSAAAQLKAAAEEEIAQLIGQPVTINLEGNLLYPTPDSGGRSFLTSLAVLLSVTMIGIGLAPHLMVEEKETRTMDALLVSPARSSHLVIAKALAGLSYCLIAAAIVLAINAGLVLHWGLAVAAVVLSSLFVVSVGLLLGSLVGAKQVLPVWSMVVLTVLMLPLFLAIMKDLLPSAATTIMSWIPTVTLSRVLRGAFSRDLTFLTFGLELLVVAACTAVIISCVAWTVRRADR
jgi:ABC-2 type transport system permease protein